MKEDAKKEKSKYMVRQLGYNNKNWGTEHSTYYLSQGFSGDISKPEGAACTKACLVETSPSPKEQPA